MGETKYITIFTDKKDLKIDVNTILYVRMSRNIAKVHVFGDKIYKTRMTMGDIEKELGDDFIRIHRSCLVSVMAIHSVDERINLVNGESLDYVVRRKKEIIDQIRDRQKSIISGFIDEDMPQTEEEYHAYYRAFDTMPFAFTDIEMIFNDESEAIDWIFRYGNPALARLEKLPLNQLIGSSFGKIFSNMDAKWLRGYERAALYGEKLEIIDYSPEIDTYQDVICFPTFKGHCGCILFEINEVKFTRESNESEKALKMYFSKLLSV